jgi:hypothetical protein
MPVLVVRGTRARVVSCKASRKAETAFSADRSRQPGDGCPHAGWRRLHNPDRGRRENKNVAENVTGHVVGVGLLKETPAPGRAILDGSTIDGDAARGTFKIEGQDRGSAVRNGFFRPAGETLSPHHQGKPRDLKKIDCGNLASCVRPSVAFAPHDQSAPGLAAGK